MPYAALAVGGLIFLLSLYWGVSNLAARRWGAAAFFLALAAILGFAGRFVWRMSAGFSRQPSEIAQKMTEAQTRTGASGAGKKQPAAIQPRGPIEVQCTRTYVAFAFFGAVVLMIFAVSMAVKAKTGGSPAVGYTLAAVLVAVAGGLVVFALKEGRPKYVAGAEGIEERHEWLGRTEVRTRIQWRDVGTVRLAEQRERIRAGSRDTRRVSRGLHLLDREGKELMYIPQPWGSDPSLDDLADAIPIWTGLEVEEDEGR